MVATVCIRVLEREHHILDAGAGTGLLGVALAEAGFRTLDALDLSPAMLVEAERKGVYDELCEGRLGDALPNASGSMPSSRVES